jgi:hypothetical protein
LGGVKVVRDERITRAERGRGTEIKEAEVGDLASAGGSNVREIEIVLDGEGRGIRYDICIDERRGTKSATGIDIQYNIETRIEDGK